MIENRMFNFANEASSEQPGALDDPRHRITRMPEELRELRKIPIGRHRVFYAGHHKKCAYTIYYIKEFKKSGVQDEDNRAFQKLLGRLKEEEKVRLIEPAKDSNQN